MVNNVNVCTKKNAMTSFLHFTKPIQIKLHQFNATFAHQFSRLVHKFIQQMVFGILKSGSGQLNSIGRALQEKISIKKVTARLGNHLGQVGLWQQVTSATLKTQATSLRKCRFVIVDLSDVSKKYAKKMEGQAGVYDGSEGETGFGYWLCNITTVNDDASIIVPTYSELFSHTAEVTSENEKILNVGDQVAPQCAPDHILLVDRGGDRLELLRPFLQADHQCIVRQVGNRHLIYRNKNRSFKYLTQHTTLQ